MQQAAKSPVVTASQVHLSLVIPLFNESNRLFRLEQGLQDFAAVNRRCSYEVILVNDGSADDTISKLRDLRDRPLNSRPDRFQDIRIVDLPTNRGKGGALRAGIEVARGQWILTLDADMSTAPAELLKWQEYDPSLDLCTAPDPGNPCVYVGSREHPDARIKAGVSRRYLGRLFNLAVQWMAGLDYDDTQCGFKLYPAEIARQIFRSLADSGWAHDVEILRRLTSAGVSIREMPVTWHIVDGGTIRCWVDGPRMVWTVAKLCLRDKWKATVDLFSPNRIWHGIGAGILGILLLLVILGFRQYGAAWDETIQNQYGETVLKFYASHGKDHSALTSSNWRYYGGLFDGIAVWFEHRLPWHPYDVRHLLNGLVGWFGLLGVWKLTRFLAGPRAGVLAICLLAIEPSFMNHLFFNPKDIPFAVGYVWSLYYLIRCIGRFPNIPNGLILKTGIAFGLTLSFRVGGVLVVGYLLLAALFYLWRPGDLSFYPARQPRRRFRPLLGSLMWMGLVAYGLMVAFWPWAIVHPLKGPLEALRAISHFTDWSGWVLIAGKNYYATDLPVSYLPHYFLVKLPELLLIGLGVGACLAIKNRRRQATRQETIRNSRWIFVILAVVFPLSYAILTRAIMYDTHRHFLFVVPLLCVMAGAAWDGLWVGLRATRPVLAVGAAAIGLIVAAEQIVTLVRLHPYEYVYYNHLVGGIRGAAGRYELDYWATSYREAVKILVEYLQRTEPDRYASTDYQVLVFGPRNCAAAFFPPNLHLLMDPQKADFYISFSRSRGEILVQGKSVGSVSRMGVDLAVVKDLRQTPPDQRLNKWWETEQHRSSSVILGTHPGK